MTILYNTQSEELGKWFDSQYLVDGKPGLLPNHILELAIIEAERPQPTETQVVTGDWVIDTDQLEYRQEWTIRELTEEELIISHNSDAEIVDNEIPGMLIKEVIRKQIEPEATTEEELIKYKEVYPAYRVEKEYLTDEKFRWNNKLWKVLQGHKSQLDWNPNEAVSLYVEIQPPGSVSEWIQPSSTNPYKIGDKVIHNANTWESEVANNVWEPGVYGWVTI